MIKLSAPDRQWIRKNRPRYQTAISMIEIRSAAPWMYDYLADMAMLECRKAEGYKFEGQKRISQALKHWDASNVAAHKLAIHLETLGTRNANVRCKAASKTSGAPIKSNILVEHLRAFANQDLNDLEQIGYRVGPLFIRTKSIYKPISPPNALIAALAYQFKLWNELKNIGKRSVVKDGICWDAAAQFATIALQSAKSLSSKTAEQMVSRRAKDGSLIYIGWAA